MSEPVPSDTAQPCRRSQPGAGLWHWMVLFGLLSCLDFVLTWTLLAVSEGGVVEGNPLAAGILESHGWTGLAYFKLAATAAVLGIGWLVARMRPRTARTLFRGVCTCLALVVGYSVYLLSAGAWDPAARRVIAQAELDEQCYRKLYAGLQEYDRYQNQLTEKLVRGERTLAQAVDDMSEWVSQNSYDPLPLLRMNCGELSDEACLAAMFVREAGYQLENEPKLARRMLHRLGRDFQREYRVRLPDFAVFPFRFMLRNAPSVAAE